MPTPDFFQARRQLRRSRLEDALGIPRSVNVDLYRNRLLERLAVAADEPVADFDALNEGVVDTVVSMALAEIDEKAIDTLMVVLMCIRVLADDGQFARLNLIADRLESLSRRLDIERPYLSTAIGSFALALQSREDQAAQHLQERLGLSGFPITPVPPSRTHLNDILMAATLRNLLAEDNREYAEGALRAAIETQEGLLYAFTEAVLSWHDAASRARPWRVLPESDPTFTDAAFVRYLERRRIGVLYPAQIRAISGGATLDESLVVSLPTSSGKTLVAEYRIAAALARHPGSRAIYVAPYRMLARQVERNLGFGFRSLGITVQDLGSAFDATFESHISGLPGVAICTPERLDSLLRLASTDSGSAAAELFVTTNVVVFDELQLVGRSGRGPLFEMVLARLKSKYPHILFLGLSAASQGADDVARWLTGRPAIAGATRPTGVLEIIWETGGVLRQRVEPRPTAVGRLPRSNAQDDAAGLILKLNPKYRPVLAIETSRQLAESLARKVVHLAPAVGAEWRDSLSPSELERINKAVEEVRRLLGDDHPLAQYMESGVAFHHAGVPTHVLQQVESLAAQRLLRIVCATTTVAEGSDLPFRVVVLPHLNFPGPTRQLDRDLYQNIIGRAGRANVSVEGLVFILDSDAPTLRNVVRSSLWRSATLDRIRSRVSAVDTTLRNFEDWSAYYEVQSQVMAWLGDGDSYVDDQAEALASTTLGWRQAQTAQERRSIRSLFAGALEDLEARGYAVAGSPLTLTTRGRNARLTGLSAPSVYRLERAIQRSEAGWLRDLVGIHTISRDLAIQIVRIIYESVEVAEKSLWLRRVSSDERRRYEALLRFADGDDGYRRSSDYDSEILLFVEWILGGSFGDIARLAPVYENRNSLFGGLDDAKRTSDATEHIGKLTYPASWTWSAVRVLAGSLGDATPSFVRTAIEAGVPSEAATQLVARAHVTRSAAMIITSISGPVWRDTAGWIQGFDGDPVQLGLTALDAERLLAVKERMMAGNTKNDY